MLDDGMPSIINHHLPESPEGKQMGGVNLRVHPELCRKLSVECNIDEDTERRTERSIHVSVLKYITD